MWRWRNEVAKSEAAMTMFFFKHATAEAADIPWMRRELTARIPKWVHQPYAVTVVREGHEPWLRPPPFVGGLALCAHCSRQRLPRRRRQRWRRRCRICRRRRCRWRRRRWRRRGRRTSRAQPLPEPYRNRALDRTADEGGGQHSVQPTTVVAARPSSRHADRRGGGRCASEGKVELE